ncbi:MAG: NAD(P)/FAD-dependent oxidoreductase [Halieaceae bacterium]|nr:NAD(P)/FAD-dependent oxidoreductase [Halieaceae bacterium]
MRAAVIGAGLSGLTAAYRLKKAGWDVLVFESEDQVGGRTLTGESGGYRYELGATVAAKSYIPYFELADELGLQLSPTPPIVSTFRDGKPHCLHLDRLVRSALTTKILSWPAKLKCMLIALDVAAASLKGYLDYTDLSKSAPIDNESAADYLRRRVGEEVHTYLGDPLIRTMTMTDADKISKVEFFSGIMNVMKSQAYICEGGQGYMADVLAEHVEVNTGHRVTNVLETESGVQVDGEEFDAAVVAAPLPVAYDICPGYRDLLSPLNQSLQYTECLSVAIGTAAVPDCPAWIVQVSAHDFPEVAQIVLEHNKSPENAPKGHGLFACLWEKDASVQYRDASDEYIYEKTLKSVCKAFPELEGTADFFAVKRWKYAIPWTKIGSYKEIGHFNAAINPAARVQFAGDYMSATGQHTAVKFGTQAANNLLCAGRGADQTSG